MSLNLSSTWAQGDGLWSQVDATLRRRAGRCSLRHSGPGILKKTREKVKKKERGKDRQEGRRKRTGFKIRRGGGRREGGREERKETPPGDPRGSHFLLLPACPQPPPPPLGVRRSPSVSPAVRGSPPAHLRPRPRGAAPGPSPAPAPQIAGKEPGSFSAPPTPRSP